MPSLVVERKIEVRYTCGKCDVVRQVVPVKARQEESVGEWMTECVAPAVQLDHMLRSPYCNATQIQQLMVPTPDPQLGVGRIKPPVIH